MTGVPHAIASIMTRPNGSGQSMGKSSAAAPAKNGCFASSFTSPMSLICAVDLRFEPFLEVAPFATRQLGRDVKLHPGSARDPDCPFRSFLGGKAPQEGEIGPLAVRGAE